MRKKNTQKINEVINNYLKEFDIEDKMKETRLIRSWEQIVGKLIANKTEKKFIKNRKLFVYLNSSIARNELMMLKDSLIRELNKKAGDDVIDDIVLK
jgi:predicted nucleic acid-binding Zn ribbon protein